MTLLVIDASVLVKWVVAEEPLEETTAARRLIRRAKLVAPRMLDAEIANVLWRKHRKGEMTRTDTDVSALALDAAPVRRESERGLWLRALALAMERDHPAYDCTYGALAERVKAAAVVTADRRFVRAFAGWRAAHVPDRPFVVAVTDAANLLDQQQ